jgi:hypothetical protein
MICVVASVGTDHFYRRCCATAPNKAGLMTPVSTTRAVDRGDDFCQHDDHHHHGDDQGTNDDPNQDGGKEWE